MVRSSAYISQPCDCRLSCLCPCRCTFGFHLGWVYKAGFMGLDLWGEDSNGNWFGDDYLGGIPGASLLVGTL